MIHPDPLFAPGIPDRPTACTSPKFCQQSQWFAVRTRPRHEKLATMMLEHKGYECFLPLHRNRRRRPDRYREILLPVFPGYLFCDFDVNVRLPILTTPGVLDIVGCGRTPIPIEPVELESIRRLVGSSLSTEPWPYVEVGRKVYIRDGPLQGVTGTLLAIRNKQRLILSVTLLRRSVAVEIEREWVVSEIRQ